MTNVLKIDYIGKQFQGRRYGRYMFKFSKYYWFMAHNKIGMWRIQPRCFGSRNVPRCYTRGGTVSTT